MQINLSDQKPICDCPGMVGREEMKEKFGMGTMKDLKMNKILGFWRAAL